MKNFKPTIFIKLFLCTSLLIFIAIFIVTISSYQKYSTSLMNQSSEKAQQIVELTSLNIETYLDDLYRLSLSPYFNPDVLDALDEHINTSDLKSLYRSRTIENFLEQILIIPRKDILRVFIMTDKIYKGERYPSTIQDNIDLTSYTWYQEAYNSEKPIFVTAHLEQIIKNPKNIVFSIVSILKSIRHPNQVLGVMKVDANYSGIKEICNKSDFGDDGGIFIIDDKQQIIFSNLSSLSYNDYISIASLNRKTDHYITTTTKNKPYLINKTILKPANWSVIGITSISTINHNIIATRNRSFIVSIICFILGLLIIKLYLFKLLNPLENIMFNIHQIQSGDLNVVFPITTNDELSYLASSLNNMITELKNTFKKNNSLLHQVYEAKYLQKEAQVNSLFNQIQPHFIYNTLNMISMLIQSGEHDKAIDIINKFCYLLRGMANSDKDVTLSTEINLLDSYLTIQKNRFLDRLDYRISIDPTLYNYVIPSLLLQPIVENSVVYGCERKKETTHIEITSEITKYQYIIIIKDDGLGMSADTLLKLKNKLKQTNLETTPINLSEKNSGIALRNVNKRIKITFGLKYGLEIDSTKHHGTTVKINLPKKNNPQT